MFHVILRQAGPGFDPALQLEQHSGWQEHGAFMVARASASAGPSRPISFCARGAAVGAVRSVRASTASRAHFDNGPRLARA
jgi:hypothetical protein